MTDEQTWRIDAGESVRDVEVVRVKRGMWCCEDIHTAKTPRGAVQVYASSSGAMGTILAPSEPTRAQLTAERDEARALAHEHRERAHILSDSVAELSRLCAALRADVARVTAERDAARAEVSSDDAPKRIDLSPWQPAPSASGLWWVRREGEGPAVATVYVYREHDGTTHWAARTADYPGASGPESWQGYEWAPAVPP